MPVVEGFSASPRFAAPISVCEIPDSLHETREPTIAQLLQEKALYSFSEWPKVKYMFNYYCNILSNVFTKYLTVDVDSPMVKTFLTVKLE